MRIATFNIWNSDCGMPERTQQIVNQIRLINADLFCLQEVKNKVYHNQLVNSCEYPHACFFNHKDEQEGLSVLSRYPIKTVKYIPNAVIVMISVDSHSIALTNLHLTWDSAVRREKEIVSIVGHLSDINADYSIITGDFNCSENSSIHRFLLGQQSLLGQEANPYLYDLAVSDASNKNTIAECTVDFKNNPRWNGENTIEVNQRFDRILLRNTYPNAFPTLMQCSIFGTDASKVSGYAPSDHYGVYVDLDFGC